MNKINRKVEYALIGLKHMRTKQPGELTTVKEISSLHGCSFEVMSKVMQALAHGGLVRAEQGAHGGYQLIRDLNRVSFHEILELIVGPIEIAKCLNDAASGSSGSLHSCELLGTCNVISPIQALNKKLGDFYRGLIVGELLDVRGSTGVDARGAPLSGVGTRRGDRSADQSADRSADHSAGGGC